MDDDGNLSRDNRVIKAGSGVVPVGMVLGKITASGKYVPRDATAVDGSQVASAIAYAEVDATSADQPAVLVKRHVEVRTSGLVWKSSEDATEIATGLAELATQMIIAR